MEQLGYRMSRTLRIYDRSIFEISDHFIKVVFAFDEVQNFCPGEQKSRTESGQVLELIRNKPNITIHELNEKCSVRKVK